MVAAVNPGKFYGSSLPRPRFYSDVKLNDERVDPPVSVMDPLLSWANDAHWSMGGLSFNRRRLQGRIEGSVKKLRAQQERARRKTASPVGDLKPTIDKKTRVSGHMPRNLAALDSDSSDPEEEEEKMEARASRSPDSSTDKKTEAAVDRTRSCRPVEEVAEIGGEADTVSSAALSRKRSAVKKNKRKEVAGETPPRRTSPRKKQAT